MPPKNCYVLVHFEISNLLFDIFVQYVIYVNERGLQSILLPIAVSTDFTITPLAYLQSFSTTWGVFSLEHGVNRRDLRTQTSAITEVAKYPLHLEYEILKAFYLQDYFGYDIYPLKNEWYCGSVAIFLKNGCFKFNINSTLFLNIEMSSRYCSLSRRNMLYIYCKDLNAALSMFEIALPLDQ